MKIDNLCVGQVLKSYRSLCEELEIKPTGGDSKKAQLKELERFIAYHKEGNKFIIDEVYDAPLSKIENRGGSNAKEYENLIIDNEKINNIGVYKIFHNDSIYIGSTFSGFKKRFQSHSYGYNKLMQHTYDLLQQGGKFEILYDMTGVEDEELVRMVESEYIREYLLNPEWNVINKKDSALTYSNYYKTKNKSIKVSDENYYEAIQLLVKHGLINREGFEL